MYLLQQRFVSRRFIIVFRGLDFFACILIISPVITSHAIATVVSLSPDVGTQEEIYDRKSRTETRRNINTLINIKTWYIYCKLLIVFKSIWEVLFLQFLQKYRVFIL